MPIFGHFGSKFDKQELVENSRFSQIWDFALFRNFWGLFCLVLGRFGWFRLVLDGLGSFWLLPKFSKYVCVCVCVFISVQCRGFWLNEDNKCNARDQASDVVLRKLLRVKYLRRHVIDNHRRDRQASNCARVSVKPSRATRSKRQFLDFSKNQR